jgi:maltooligosyltrehalose trehalohydrolase
MARDAEGWHRLTVPGAAHGDSYSFELPDGTPCPTRPRASTRTTCTAPAWSSTRALRMDRRRWRGRPWEEAVVYELHIGAFTAEGTFNAARERLAALAELGVTAIELMPLADFPGRATGATTACCRSRPMPPTARPTN